MKTVKHLILTGAILILGLTSNAVETGFTSGFNMSSLTHKPEVTDFNRGAEFNPSYGVNFGPVVNFDITKRYSLETAVLYSKKGMKVNLEGNEYYGEGSNGSIDVHYLTLPIRNRFAFPVGKLDLFASVGGYLGYGVMGKSEFEYHDPHSAFKRNDNQEFDFENDIKRIDLGLNATVGIQISEIELSMGYERGLVDLYQVESDENPLGFQTWTANFTYKFDWSKN